MDPVERPGRRTDTRRLTALRASSAVGFGAVALVVAAFVGLLVPGVLSTASLHPRTANGAAVELAAGSAMASGSQETEPEGVDTTDPEASGEDGSGVPDWVMYVVIGAVTAVVLVWYLGRLNRQDSAGGD